MNPAQQQPPAPANPTDLMAAAIQQQLMSNLGNPAFMNNLTSQVMISVGNTLRLAGHHANPDLDIKTVLTAPALLENDVAIVITNQARLLNGSFRMLVTDTPLGEDQVTRNATLFIENDVDLSKSQIVNLTPDQAAEIMRQLQVIGHTGTRLYHVHVIVGKIDGFPYFRPEEPVAAAGGSEGGEAGSEVNAGAPAAAPAPAVEANGTLDAPLGDPMPGLVGDAIPGTTVPDSTGGQQFEAELASKS